MGKEKIEGLKKTLKTINDGIQSSKNDDVKGALQSEYDRLNILTEKLKTKSTIDMLRSDGKDQKQSIQKKMQERKISLTKKKNYTAGGRIKAK